MRFNLMFQRLELRQQVFFFQLLRSQFSFFYLQFVLNVLIRQINKQVYYQYTKYKLRIKIRDIFPGLFVCK